jgi:murein DD-endopeptidase MepM/ murein hydrolase activator NlpD
MKKIFKLFILFIVVALFFNGANLVWGSYEEEINAEIKNISSKINDNKQKIETIQNKQKEYRNLLVQKQSEKNTLTNEIEILETNVSNSKLEIEATELEIDKTNLEIKKTTIDIANTDEQINNEKEHIASLLRMMYREDQVSALEILLLNDSLAEFINQVKYLENTNDEIAKSVEKLKIAKDKLETGRELLTKKQTELEDLKKSMEEKVVMLEKQREDKDFILEETRQSEKQYQSLIEKARQEEARASSEISGLEKKAREKLESLKNKPVLNYTGFIWPVKKSYITARFHDPDYPFRRSLGEHSGVDIKASQGSTLYAAADGYVARVKFDGTKNYAYIMIIHGDGLSTVYGHVSGVSVSVDDYVAQGQVIGRTGGLPGGIGSGGFSTGAHLHFEVRRNGIPVDPQDFIQ